MLQFMQLSWYLPQPLSITNPGETMKACHPLHPSLNALIDRGLLTCRQAAEVSAFAAEIHTAVSRGEITRMQADALRHLLGVQYAADSNAQRSVRRLQ
jgi:hypothetical protein